MYKLTPEAIAKAWDCHSWDNCPIMSVAFGVHEIASVPLYRREAEFFVQLFDARLIPNPIVRERDEK